MAVAVSTNSYCRCHYFDQVVCQCCNCIVLLAYIYFMQPHVATTWAGFSRSAVIDKAGMKQFLKLAIPGVFSCTFAPDVPRADPVM